MPTEKQVDAAAAAAEKANGGKGQMNPFKLRQFAKASGVLAKNDRLDARMIALFTSVMPTRPAQQRHPVTERLAQIVTARRELSDDCRERRGQSYISSRSCRRV